jgi:hypothetical protein
MICWGKSLTGDGSGLGAREKCSNSYKKTLISFS